MNRCTCIDTLEKRRVLPSNSYSLLRASFCHGAPDHSRAEMHVEKRVSNATLYSIAVSPQLRACLGRPPLHTTLLRLDRTVAACVDRVTRLIRSLYPFNPRRACTGRRRVGQHTLGSTNLSALRRQRHEARRDAQFQRASRRLPGALCAPRPRPGAARRGSHRRRAAATAPPTRVRRRARSRAEARAWVRTSCCCCCRDSGCTGPRKAATGCVLVRSVPLLPSLSPCRNHSHASPRRVSRLAI